MSHLRRPLIGLSPDHLPARGHTKYTVYDRYPRALRAAGASAVVLDPEPSAVNEQLELVSGLLLPGGDDLDPALWGERPASGHEPSDPRRTAYELALLRGALERDLPLLGVCLGMQLLNVACGGSIIQDLPVSAVRHQDLASDLALRHDVRLEPGSLLARAMERPEGGRCSVNSYHHQAPGRIGADLLVSARADDGVVEALEHVGQRFCLGVQWHPDADASSDPGSAALFRAFAAACRETTAG